jgi:hypothetical protein
MPNTKPFPNNIVIQVTNYDLMTNRKGTVVPEQKDSKTTPAIVYRSVAQKTKEHVYSFTLTQAQAEFVKTHRKEINFSQTFRKYLDTVIQAHSPKQ